MRTFRKSNPSTCLNCKCIFYPFFAAEGLFCEAECYRAYKTSPEMLAKRFWERVNKNGPIPKHRPELGPCWLYTGLLNESGYGLFVVVKKHVRAHRMAWDLMGHPDPGDKFLCHHCDNPPCVRDSHLFIGTAKDNANDCNKKGRNPVRNRKLTEEKVLKIRAHYANGMTHLAISKLFGMSREQIGNIVRRKHWNMI